MIGVSPKLACPNCDTLYHIPDFPLKSRALCARCDTVLATSREHTIPQVIALALTALILMLVVCFFPFLSLKVASGSNQASIFDAVIAFSGQSLFPVAVFMATLIIILPIARFLLLIYTLGPLALNAKPFPNAIRMFRLSEELRPWCMVEIFVVGLAVSMVKLVGLAQISFGPAFWAVIILVPLSLWKDSMISRWSIWEALERR